MRTFRTSSIPASEITPRDVFLNRRKVLAGLGLALTAPSMARVNSASAETMAAQKSPLSTAEPMTALKDITTYNNYYEFGLEKDEPAASAHLLKVAPWSVVVDGLVAKPRTFAIEDLIKTSTLEERIYRMRCVEAWSMVIPWIGIPLASVLSRVEPLGSAKFVAFESVVRPSEMPGQSGQFPSLPWPYREGLRLDEAMNPLTLLATGLYGETLPNQCGAPIRLVVPWKYGFKGAKAIVRISLVEAQPPTTWSKAGPNEYGFYANVNPEVDHPRWSQATERRIGEGGLFAKRRQTLKFNGYAEQVASLYSGMDLKANF